MIKPQLRLQLQRRAELEKRCVWEQLCWGTTALGNSCVGEQLCWGTTALGNSCVGEELHGSRIRSRPRRVRQHGNDMITMMVMILMIAMV